MIAPGQRADGYREGLGVDVGDSENEMFWTDLLGSLVDRKLRGVRLVISDAHTGYNDHRQHHALDGNPPNTRYHQPAN